MPPPSPSSGCDADSAPSRSAIIGRGTAASGHHVLDIEGYSYTKEIPTGTFIRSKSFRAVGNSWRILYYPNGRDSSSSEYISVMLVLSDDHATGEPVEARARFSLLDRAGKPVPSHTRTTRVYNYSGHARGYSRFIKRAFVEKSEHLQHDQFTVRCDVLVANKEFHTEDRKRKRDAPLVTVPTSDPHRHFGHLLETKDGADVTFQVAGETFMAHRCVLAARLPVFRAELFGKMKEGTDRGAIVRVDDMDAQVFKALLDFVYTDALPDDDSFKDKEGAAMAQHLLVAADRYSLERLKLICQDMLCDNIDTCSAATILTLAEQHQCHGLKEACFRFLSTPSTLNAVMATDDFDHLTRSFPSVLKQLMSNIAARLPGDFGEA